ALGAVAVFAVVLDLRGGDQCVHGRAGRQYGTGLTAGSLLHAEARAEDLEAGDDPHPEDRERDRDLDERETNTPGGPSSARAPLVLPFGKKSICTTPSPKAWPPWTSSMTARSVSTAQRPQPVVWMLFSRASMTSSCGWPSATASPRQ